MTNNVYQKVLNSLTVKDLKQIIRDYMSHLKITMSKKTKDQLITHILEHTDINDRGEIRNKVYSVHTIPKKKEQIKKITFGEPKIKKYEITKEEKKMKMPTVIDLDECPTPSKDIKKDDLPCIKKNTVFKNMKEVNEYIDLLKSRKEARKKIDEEIKIQQKKEVTKKETKKEEKITESKKEITKKEETNKETQIKKKDEEIYNFLQKIRQKARVTPYYSLDIDDNIKLTKYFFETLYDKFLDNTLELYKREGYIDARPIIRLNEFNLEFSSNDNLRIVYETERGESPYTPVFGDFSRKFDYPREKEEQNAYIENYLKYVNRFTDNNLNLRISKDLMTKYIEIADDKIKKTEKYKYNKYVNLSLDLLRYISNTFKKKIEYKQPKEQLIDKVEKSMIAKEKQQEKQQEQQLEKKFRDGVLDTLIKIDDINLPKEKEKQLKSTLKELTSSKYDIKYKLNQLDIFNESLKEEEPQTKLKNDIIRRINRIIDGNNKPFSYMGFEHDNTELSNSLKNTYIEYFTKDKTFILPISSYIIINNIHYYEKGWLSVSLTELRNDINELIRNKKNIQKDILKDMTPKRFNIKPNTEKFAVALNVRDNKLQDVVPKDTLKLINDVLENLKRMDKSYYDNDKPIKKEEPKKETKKEETKPKPKSPPQYGIIKEAQKQVIQQIAKKDDEFSNEYKEFLNDPIINNIIKLLSEIGTTEDKDRYQFLINSMKKMKGYEFKSFEDSITNLWRQLKKKKEVTKEETQKPEQEAQKPEPEKQTQESIIEESEVYKLNNDIFKIIEDLLKTTSPYKRKEKVDKSFNSITNLVKKQKVININENDLKFLYDYLNNYYVQKQSDFFPTPTECLNNETINKSILGSNNILEPTAGLGHILNYIRKLKKTEDEEYKLTAIEYTEHMTDFLKIFSPDTVINPNGINNFLNYNPEKVSYDLIIINPPFTQGNDSRYYFDFLFHCLYLMNRSNINYHPEIIFISPPIVEGSLGIQFTLNDILDFKYLSKNKKQEIFKRYNIKNEDEVEDVFNILYGESIGECKGFTGTGFKANMYYIQGYDRSKDILPKRNLK